MPPIATVSYQNMSNFSRDSARIPLSAARRFPEQIESSVARLKQLQTTILQSAASQTYSTKMPSIVSSNPYRAQATGSKMLKKNLGRLERMSGLRKWGTVAGNGAEEVSEGKFKNTRVPGKSYTWVVKMLGIILSFGFKKSMFTLGFWELVWIRNDSYWNINSL